MLLWVNIDILIYNIVRIVYCWIVLKFLKIEKMVLIEKNYSFVFW